MRDLKRTLVIPVLDQEVTVDVDFRVIETIERVFDMNADAVVALFSDSRKVQRNKVADVIVGWLAFKDLGVKRRDIREAVITATPDLMSLYTTSIYAALLFVLNYYDRNDPVENAKKFDELIAGPDWPRINRQEDDGKKKASGRKRSSPNATG